MTTERIDVIATTVSGSIQDWKKVERIKPLFGEQGLTDVYLHVVDSHREARRTACRVVVEGGRLPISAGGSGTFKNVLEGCIDAGVPLAQIRLGFLRKGSADLIGKVLGMPDRIEEAAAVFADSITRDLTLPCDVLQASCPDSGIPVQHFVGYGGAEIFGRIPHFTENRFMKWYKGILGQIFGDLGPFSTGMTLALGERICRGPFGRRRTWRIRIDGRDAAHGSYQALIILNGYLGPELAFSRDPLGSGHFELFALKDIGWIQLPRQILQARRGIITKDPRRWGLESFQIHDSLELATDPPAVFPANVDGSTLLCPSRLRVGIVGRIRLLAAASAVATGRPATGSSP